MTTKIAFPTDDGETISRHFGQAQYFKVFTLDEGLVSGSELRPKASHQHGDHSHGDDIHPGQQMVETIADCQILVGGGMGAPALARANTAGLEVILTKETSIQAALASYLAGTLENVPALVHSHH
jgi:predicted Fe-Mo cluster-binding NifX family protein